MTSAAWMTLTKAAEGEEDHGDIVELAVDGSQLSTVYSQEDMYTDHSETTETMETFPNQDGSSAKFEPFRPGTARSVGSTKRSEQQQQQTTTLDQEAGAFDCRYYKHEKLQQEIDTARSQGQPPREAILATLKCMGVNVFVVTSSTGDLADIVTNVRRIVNVVAQENRLRPQFNCRIFQRCLLFQDHQGRLFNLVLAHNAIGPAAEFRATLESFSGWQAMVGLTILARSLRCASDVEEIGNLQPTYLTLILGLILAQEIAYSWLSVAMLLRAFPSISAYTLNMRVGSDWLKKGTLLLFTVAGTTQGRAQRVIILTALSMASMVLLANLGSRAWYYLQWKPFGYNGPFASVLAYVLAIFTGLVVPYMGHREVEVGGKAALESVLQSAVVVAVFFVLSAFAEVKKFIVLGLDTCEQQEVDYVVGIWWALTLVIAIFQVRRIKPPDPFPKDEEPLLVQDDKSPVGYRVPNLPDFAIDPVLARDGSRWCNFATEALVGFAMALLVGLGIVWLALTKRADSLSFKTVV